jgi:hypothetical protein
MDGSLTPGKGDGTLQLIPIAESMVYVLLRAIQDDVAEDDLCGAQPGRALSISDPCHCLLIQELSSIPLMQPGDTVFGHSDVVHAVENEPRGSGHSNGMYIGSAPGCPKNTASLERQALTFVAGKTPPDFPADNFEVDFAGRGTVADLTELVDHSLESPRRFTRARWRAPLPDRIGDGSSGAVSFAISTSSNDGRMDRTHKVPRRRSG